MKKIFSILLCLAMLVSLAALTTTPVSAATECVCPTLSPASGTFDLSNPCPVAVSIKLNDATTVNDVKFCNGTSLDAADWEVYSNCLLVITADFLATVLKDHGDCVCLDVEFDVCVVNFVITATGKDTELNPTSRDYAIGSGASVNTTVLWGCKVNAITTITQFENPTPINPSGSYDLVLGTDYTIGATNTTTNSAVLTISGTYIAKELFNLDAVIKLVIDFDCCHNATFTIKGVKKLSPDLSPRAVPYIICCNPAGNLDPLMGLPACGCCCYNVCTEIVWNNRATNISSVIDVTNQQAPSRLTRDVDYWLSDDYSTLVLNGCISRLANGTVTSWGGLFCRLDACSRLARLISVTFNDDCNTSVILTVNSAGYTSPSVTPTSIVVDLDAALCDPLMVKYQYSGTVVSLGSAQCINNVTDITQNVNCGTLMYNNTAPALSPGTGLLFAPAQWMLSYVPAYGGSLLLLSRYYYVQATDAQASLRVSNYLGYNVTVVSAPGANIVSLNSTPRTLLIQWTPDNLPALNTHMSAYPWQYCPTIITIGPTGIGATICPNKAEYNMDEANDPVQTEITWGNWAKTIKEIRASKCSVPLLVEGTDYVYSPNPGNCTQPSVLNITDTYLNKVLKNIGDQIVLTIKFDNGPDATLTIVATGTPMCFIATASGADAPQLDILRAFRDDVMRGNPVGDALIDFYYTVSPGVADVIADNGALATAVRLLLVNPLAAVLG